MEFADVVAQRRMVRSFSTEPVDGAVLDAMLALAAKGPSAGNTAGTHFVVLNGPAETARYWDVTLPPERRDAFPWPRLLNAPVLVLPCGDQQAYVERYGEADKARSGLGAGADAWQIPYWHVDTAMAAMTLLHAAVDAGLGALFFGIFDHEPALAQALGIPSTVRPIGTIAIGHADGDDRLSKSARRGRPALEDVVHRGSWRG